MQTLSRLNRTYRTPSGTSKTAAMTEVVDFVNEPETIREAFEPYYTDAFLETETDPNLVHDLSAKLDTFGIYTDAEINQCAEAMVKGLGHDALTAAVQPGKKRFAERYQAALIDNGGEGDKAALAELDMFRKDVGSFVRLYDFMSQIINYGDPALEKKQIYLRNLDRVIKPENYSAQEPEPCGDLRNGAPLEQCFRGIAACVDETGLLWLCEKLIPTDDSP